MHRASLHRIGEAVVVDVPPDYLERTGLKAEGVLSWAIEGDRLILRPAESRPEYSLDELLAQCDLSEPPPEEDREWAASGSVGKELL